MAAEDSAEERKARRVARMRRLMIELSDHPEGLTWDEAWQLVCDKVPLVADDLVTTPKASVPRGENEVRFAIINPDKAGWVLTAQPRYRITRIGREALLSYADPVALDAASTLAYNKWKALTASTEMPDFTGHTSTIWPKGPAEWQIRQAGSSMVRKGFGDGLSVFDSSIAAWTAETAADLTERFVMRPDTSPDSFLKKLTRQLERAPDATKLLAAELLSLILLPLMDWSGYAKRKQVKNVLAMMADPVHLDLMTSAAMDHGAFGGGIGFKTGLWGVLGTAVTIVNSWWGLPAHERTETLSDPWAWRDFLFADPAPSYPAARLELLYLAHPGSFLPIVSQDARERIREAFTEDLSAGASADIDRDLLNIALALQSESGKPVNFYQSPWVERWRHPASGPGRRAWLVRSSSISGYDLVPAWLADGFLSLPATSLDRIDEPITRPAVAEAITQAFAGRPADYRRRRTDDYDRFLRIMKPGDRVLTTSEGLVHIGEIEADPEWVSDSDLPAKVRRAVSWLSDEGIASANLPEPLPARLSASDDVTDLTEDLDLIESLIPDEVEPEHPPVVPVIRPKASLPAPTQELANSLHIDLAWLARLTTLTRRRHQVILYGPPGTGKTFVARALANQWTGAESGNVVLVQFHPSVAYEDFVAGYRPVEQDGHVVFQLRQGPFMRLAERARDNPGAPFLLIIDEINRANLAKVFGELYGSPDIDVGAFTCDMGA